MSDPTKPSELPTWATNGDRVQPPAEKQEQGFLPGEPARAQYFNWIFNRIGKWLGWVDSVLSGPLLPISGSDEEPPRLELQSDRSYECGEVHWTSEKAIGDDKRIAAISAQFAVASLSMKLRNIVTNTLESCMVISNMQTWLQTAVTCEKSLTTPVLYLQPGSGNASNGGPSVVELAEGETTFDVGGSSWVKVLVSESVVSVTGLRGCRPGQLLFCEFEPVDPETELRMVKLRHLEGWDPTEWSFFSGLGMDYYKTVKTPNDPHVSVTFALLCTERHLHAI